MTDDIKKAVYMTLDGPVRLEDCSREQLLEIISLLADERDSHMRAVRKLGDLRQGRIAA